jgi:hypothetical protein
MGTGDPATAWSGVIVNLFKAGDTQLPGNYRITLVSICRKMFTNMLRKRIRSQVHLHEAQAAFRSKDPAQTTCSCSRASSKRLARPTKLSMRSFWTCKAYDTVWRDGLSAKLLERCGWKVMAGCRDLAIKSTSQVRVNGDLSEAFP